MNLVYSQRNRSACIRIPMYSDSAKAKRIEFRPPDSAANPYLAFSAMLMAGLDGIERGLDPGEPADFDLFEHADGGIPQVPGSLSGGARRARGRPRVPARRRRVLEGAHRDLDRLEAGERGRRRAAAPAPGGVRALLRLLARASQPVGRPDPRRRARARRSPPGLPICAVAVELGAERDRCKRGRGGDEPDPLRPIPSVRRKPTSQPMKSATPAASSSAIQPSSGS